MYGYGDYVCLGMGEYYCSEGSLLILCWCLGDVLVQVYVEGVLFCLGWVQVLLYLVGYVLGFLQVCIDDGWQVWVVFGDYKWQFDLICVLFEVVFCDIFIIEVIFVLLIYCWLDILVVVVEIVVWCCECE